MIYLRVRSILMFFNRGIFVQWVLFYILFCFCLISFQKLGMFVLSLLILKNGISCFFWQELLLRILLLFMELDGLQELICLLLVVVRGFFVLLLINICMFFLFLVIVLLFQIFFYLVCVWRVILCISVVFMDIE